MAIGKVAKRLRNLEKIIQPKLDAKMLTDTYYEDFKKDLDKRATSKKTKFKMYVYNHQLLNGAEFTKQQWLDWMNAYRKANNV